MLIEVFIGLPLLLTGYYFEFEEFEERKELPLNLRKYIKNLKYFSGILVQLLK